MNLKYVIAARHGHDNGGLSGEGVKQAQGLAEAIMGVLNGAGEVLLFSSHALRAKQTGDIISERLGIDNQVCESLWGDYYSDAKGAMEGVLELVADKDPQAIVMVSHFEVPAGLVDGFSSLHLGRNVSDTRAIPKGSALVLELGSGEVSQLP